MNIFFCGAGASPLAFPRFFRGFRTSAIPASVPLGEMFRTFRQELRRRHTEKPGKRFSETPGKHLSLPISDFFSCLFPDGVLRIPLYGWHISPIQSYASSHSLNKCFSTHSCVPAPIIYI